jgi:hypothetical protein
VQGQWILDLDAAEAAAPGTVMGQPLDVVVEIFDGFNNSASTIDVTMTARLEKKH